MFVTFIAINMASNRRGVCQVTSYKDSSMSTQNKIIQFCKQKTQDT